MMDDLSTTQLFTAFRQGYISIGELEDELIDRGLSNEDVQIALELNIRLRSDLEEAQPHPVFSTEAGWDKPTNVISLDKYRRQ